MIIIIYRFARHRSKPMLKEVTDVVAPSILRSKAFLLFEVFIKSIIIIFFFSLYLLDHDLL